MYETCIWEGGIFPISIFKSEVLGSSSAGKLCSIIESGDETSLFQVFIIDLCMVNSASVSSKAISRSQVDIMRLGPRAGFPHFDLQKFLSTFPAIYFNPPSRANSK